MKILTMIILFNYISFIIISTLIIIPIIIILYGVIGLKDSIIDNKDLSYERYKSARKEYYKWYY